MLFVNTRVARLRAALLGRDRAPEPGFHMLEERCIADRPADAFGPAQALLFSPVIPDCGRQGAEVRIPLLQRRYRGDAVIAAQELRVHARPGPGTRILDQPRPHRIEQHVTHGSGQMRLVHRHGAEPALPEMFRSFLPLVGGAGVAAVDFRERPAQAVRVPGQQDQMHVVGQQAPSPDLGARRLAGLAQKVPLQGIFAGTEKVRCLPLPRCVT